MLVRQRRRLLSLSTCNGAQALSSPSIAGRIGVMEILIWLGVLAWFVGAVGAYFVVSIKLSKEIKEMTPDQRREFFKTRRQR